MRQEENMTRNKVGNISPSKSIIIVLVLIVFVLTGCTTMKKIAGTSEQDPTQISPQRDEAVRVYGYDGVRDMVFVETPTIMPPIVARGARLNRQLRFAVLSPDTTKRFRVTEVVTLSGGSISIELSRKETVRSQAIHISSLDFVIPRDLPRGDYKLITTIIAGKERKTVSGSFKVRLN